MLSAGEPAAEFCGKPDAGESALSANATGSVTLLVISGVLIAVVSAVSTWSGAGSLSSESLVGAASESVSADAAKLAAGCSVGTRTPGISQATDEGGACAGAAVMALPSASELSEGAGFVALPDFAAFDPVAATLLFVVAFAAATGGATAAGMIVGRVVAGGRAAGAARGGGVALGAALLGGWAFDGPTDGCKLVVASDSAGIFGAATEGGCEFGAAAARGIVVVGPGAVARVTGGLAGSVASKAAFALSVVAGGADAAGAALLSLGLAGAVGVADAPCEPNPLSSEKKSASALDEESGVPAFPALAPEPAAVVAAAEFDAECDIREEAADTFLSAMCGSLGKGTTLRAFVRLALLGQVPQALLLIFPAIDEPADDFCALRGVLPAHALGITFAARARYQRRLLPHGLREACEKGLIIAQARTANARFGTLIELARIG
jgi:hypothetical protein